MISVSVVSVPLSRAHLSCLLFMIMMMLMMMMFATVKGHNKWKIISLLPALSWDRLSDLKKREQGTAILEIRLLYNWTLFWVLNGLKCELLCSQSSFQNQQSFHIGYSIDSVQCLVYTWAIFRVSIGSNVRYCETVKIFRVSIGSNLIHCAVNC